MRYSDTDDVHTFLFGLERLLLGTVLPPDYQQTYAGVQAVANIEADSFCFNWHFNPSGE
jgi:exonuclease V gamma subunit